MSVLMVPQDSEPWPSLGGEVCDWIEANLVFGPGDLRGEPAVLDEEKAGFVYRFYEIFPEGHPQAGRRRFKRCALSLAKGLAKTEFAAWIAAAELHHDAPVRCHGWRNGRPIGGPVTDPYIPLVAYTEEQSDELAYGALHAILSECRLRDDFDIGLERIMRLGGDGKAVSLSSSPSARDGARTTFQLADETHWWTSEKLRSAHQTMLANIPKRRIADAWALEVTTAYEPGAGSVAEATHEYARMIAEGRTKDARLFYFHRQADEELDLDLEEDALQAVIQASGAAASWRDIESIVELWRDPTTDRRFWERVWTNRPVQSMRKAFDLAAFREQATEYTPPDGAMITVGFDGAQFHDATALVCTEIRTGYQWLFRAWEQPAGPEGEKWQVPDDEVDRAVAEIFDTWNVWRMYADPPYWQSWISKWRGRYGEDRVIEWWTNRRRAMAMALDLFVEALQDAELTHDGSDVLVRHIGNAHKQDLPSRTADGSPLWLIRKEKVGSPFKIDAAMAAVLSWEARTDAIASGVTGETETVFNDAGLIYWSEPPTGPANRYIVVCPPHEKRPDPEISNLAVIELRPDRTRVVLAMVRARLTLVERTDLVFQWHRDYDPLKVGYEKRGLEGDREHVLDQQKRENYRFKLWPLDSSQTEDERIARLVPIVENEQLVIPETYVYGGVDMTGVFRQQEFAPYPYGSHHDMLDCLSRQFDLNTKFPARSTHQPRDVFPSDF